MNLTMVGMSMHTSNPAGYKDLDANLQQTKRFGYKWYTNVTYERSINKLSYTIEAKNNVAETVVAPSPLVATWGKTMYVIYGRTIDLFV